VWASNDPDLVPGADRKGKIDTKSLSRGGSIISDPLSPQIDGIRKAIADEMKSEKYLKIQDELSAVADELLKLSSQADTADTQAKRAAARAAADRYNDERNALLSEIANKHASSIPAFDAAKLDASTDRYLFYKPVLYAAAKGGDAYIGMVRLEVSTEEIMRQIARDRMDFVRISLLIAVISLGFGVVGALFLAFIVISPIKRLVRGVEVIRDTTNKEKLSGHKIEIGTRDEIRTLADTINQMTRGLVRGAKDNADLLAGEQDQRELLPLETDLARKKLAVGHLDAKDIEFFGFYKGAKLVSGDYLDFRSLDGRYYAFIKADVSGKGVSAAMIMAIVASVFRRWFDGWTPQKPGFKLSNFCYAVNETLNVCEFRGKFATLMTGIVDSQTGKVCLCHAGDKFYRVYETDRQQLVTYELTGTAPAGPFANFMIEGQSPFKEVFHDIKVGDVLLLYTDGIDEARRYWRNEKYEKIHREHKEEEAQGPANRFKENKGSEEKDYEFEDFGNERAAAIFEAVMARKTFVLTKEHDPSGDTLEFDFRDCGGKLEEVILALVSVEKVFRMYRAPNADADDQVKVDVRIDAFLRDHFRQYGTYCAHRIDNPEEAQTLPVDDKAAQASPHYLIYTHLFEDEQYDDITVLSMRRK
jgi:serine phosphatase RsbU (regulator of sigma subunit)